MVLSRCYYKSSSREDNPGIPDHMFSLEESQSDSIIEDNNEERFAFLDTMELGKEAETDRDI